MCIHSIDKVKDKVLIDQQLTVKVVKFLTVKKVSNTPSPPKMTLPTVFNIMYKPNF